MGQVQILGVHLSWWSISTQTNWDLWSRWSLIHLRIYLSASNLSNICRRGRRGTVSKALLTSKKKNTIQTSYPWSRACDKSSITLIRADTVEWADMKPHCCGEIDAVFCKWFSLIDFTWRSMSLLITGRLDIGLYPNRSVLSDPLGIWTILAVFHSKGKVPLEMETLNKVVREQCLQQWTWAFLWKFHHSQWICSHEG